MSYRRKSHSKENKFNICNNGGSQRVKSNQVRSRSSAVKKESTFYSVEEILGRREFQGKVEYLLKWKGYPDSYNSWEEPVNITSDLIEEFEVANTALEMMSKTPRNTVILKDTPIKIIDIQKVPPNDDIEYLVQWKTETELDWVSGDIMRDAFPDLVIEFYERITSMVD